ncbi:MAG: GxxExxY protein, partial [Pirellulaceae bacterium]|nr:GxxExxY protein [Pirellulaceae bacterium]
MPISIPINLKRLDQDEFKQLDYAVMGHAYQCQNALGRLCEEGIYQRDLADRLESAGLGPVRVEFPIQVTHGDFATTYSADLVVADSAIYELKTAAALSGEHKKQLLNYLLLCEQPRGKLVNFRPAGVESQYVNTQLTLEKRREFSVDASRWMQLGDRCEKVARLLAELLRDWGGFLETSLYL